MKPIEEGCIAVLIASRVVRDPDVGRAFTIGPQIDNDGYACIHCGTVNSEWLLMESPGWCACACLLVRIDDGDFENEDVDEPADIPVAMPHV